MEYFSTTIGLPFFVLIEFIFRLVSMDRLVRMTPTGLDLGEEAPAKPSKILRDAAAEFFGGLIAVANPNANGADVYKYFLTLGIKGVDFLFPDGNYINPPFHTPAHRPVSEFMIEVFDEWYGRDDPSIRVRLFTSIIESLLGKESSLDFFGNINGSIAVIETDGGILPHDVLRICGSDYDASKLNVAENAIGDLQSAEFFPWLELAHTCRECSLLPVCGGGYPPHRFDGVSFRNPSYYCDDLKRLISHIARRVVPGIPRAERAKQILLMQAASGVSGRHRVTAQHGNSSIM
jgi:radical SAM protein with 4Fe4S-binding SPASM domain